MWAIARCLYAHGVTCKVSVMRPWQTSGTKYGKSTPPQSPSFSSWHKSEKLCTPSLLPRRSTETGKHDQSQKLWQNGLRKGRPMVLFFFLPSRSSIRAAIRWHAKEILKRDEEFRNSSISFNPVAHNPSMKCSNQFQTLKWSWCLLQLHLSLSYNQHESDRRNKEVKSESWDQKCLVPKCIPHCTGWGEAASCQQLCQLF